MDAAYHRKYRKRNLLKLRTYQRLYRQKRRKDPAFRRREAIISLRWSRKHRAANRKRWNESRRLWDVKKRRLAAQRLGRVCRFQRCGKTRGLFIHHNHKLQRQLGCCRSENGCKRCQVCMLCSQHNHMLAMVSDNLRTAKKVVAFLRRYH